MPPHSSPVPLRRSGAARTLLARTLSLRAGALLALVAAGALGACGSSDSVTGSSDVSGAYALRTLDGKTPPVTVIDTTYTSGGQTGRLTAAVTGGTVTLVSSGTYTVALTYTLNFAGQPQPTTPLADAGTWTRTGSTVAFASTQGQGNFSGTLSGTGTLTVAQDIVGNGVPVSMVFQK